MAVATIIVNYNTASMVLAHLAALREEMKTVPGSHAYIVDNASPKGDAAILRDAVEEMEDVTLIAAPENGGFSYGNNRGFERALSEGPYDHLFMLNPDAYPTPGCFETLIRFLDARPDVGIVAPRLQGEDGLVQRSAFRFPTVLNEFLGRAPLGPLFRFIEGHIVAPPPQTTAHACDWVAGAALMIRGDALRTVGLMDEAYFLYFEEVDHQRAFHQAGYSIWYEPRAAAVHLVGQATGIVHGRQEGKAAPDYWYDSRRRYFLKQHGPRAARWADMACSTAFQIIDLRQALSGKAERYHAGQSSRLKAAAARVPSLTSPSDKI